MSAEFPQLPMSGDAPGATVGDAPAPQGVLVIGYGNTLRRDDGVGVRAAELLAVDPRLAVGRSAAGVEVLSCHQLTPELALDIGAASLVILIDADVGAEPGAIAVRPIDATVPRSVAAPRAEPGASSHHLGGGELVALAEELTGHRPEAIAVGIGVADLELGEGLSSAVEAALSRAVDMVARLVAEHRPG